MATRDDLAAMMAQCHQGKANGVTADHLALRLSIEPREVRRAIAELRMEGVQVCGHPKTGYYIAENAEDLEATCEFLRKRAMHSLTLESRLRRIALPELLGQMKLKT